MFASTSNCPVSKCTSCELVHAKKCSLQVVWQHAIKEKEGILALDKYQPGDFVSIDQLVVSTPGWLLYGWEGDNNRFHGGIILNVATTDVIWVENQVFLGAGETIIAKTHFEL